MMMMMMIIQSRIIREGDEEISIPERVHLSFQHIDSHGAYLLDTSEYIYVYIGKAISDHFLQHVFNVTTFSSLQFDAVKKSFDFDMIFIVSFEF